MATSVRLDDGFVSHAKIHAEAENRSLPKQIEYWAKVGQIMIDNPDLPYEFESKTGSGLYSCILDKLNFIRIKKVKRGQVFILVFWINSILLG